VSETKLTGLALLRAPFPPHQISKLPKPLKKRDEMDKLPKAMCRECGNYHATSSVMHLDYVGHAALTDRLLDADDEWTWQPVAVDADGLPKFDKHGGLWIFLTVCGVTRRGYGHAGDKTGGDAIKEVIGDALRNAAMRFGAALDLWHKGDLHVETDDAPEPPQPPAPPAPPDGYDQWWSDMVATADTGLDALAAAFKASPKPFAAYMNQTNRAGWDALKAKAAKVAA